MAWQEKRVAQMKTLFLLLFLFFFTLSAQENFEQKNTSSITAEGLFLKDSDSIHHTIASAYANYFFDSQTSLFAGGEMDILAADSTSLYKNSDGSNESSVQSGGVGMRHRFHKTLETGLLLGYTKEKKHETLWSRADIRLDINDESTLYLDASHGFYMISPLSTSLGIKRAHGSTLFELRPTLIDTVLLQGEYDVFSDTNRRWSAVLAPRHGVVRNNKWAVDLGVKAWLSGFKKDLEHGYYDPKLFESYMATLHATYGIFKYNTLFFMSGAGAIRDNFMHAYKPGGNIDIILSSEIDKDWKIQAKTGYMNNSQERLGDYYDAYYFGLSVMRRF